MLPESYVKPHLSLMPGKYAQPPNVVVVPSNRKSFPIEVAMTMHTERDAVVVSPNKQHSHEWCVLDQNLKQVMVGAVKRGLRVGKTDSDVERTLMGGAENPDDFDVELSSAKLRNGATYTLLCKAYGVMAALDFVAVHPPKKKAAKKKVAKKKVAKKKVAKKRAVKKRAAKKKAAPKKKAAAKKRARKAKKK